MIIILVISAIIVFLLGLAVGSFVNALVYRTEQSISIWRGRSMCPECQAELVWHDLIPLASFIARQGKCRYCGKPISIQYPLVELSAGIVFLVVYYFYFESFSPIVFFKILYLFAVSATLVAIFVYDYKHSLIPDIYTYFGLTLAFLASFTLASISGCALAGKFCSVWSSIIGALAAGGFFFILVVGSGERWMGWGDVKLGAFLGAVLGWPNVLVALFAAFCAGAIIGIALMLTGQKKIKSQIPFGPFLVFGTFIAMFFGNNLIFWYLGLLNL